MKTFTVIGLGRFGTSVATQLFNMGYEVLAIDKNMDKINAIANFGNKSGLYRRKRRKLVKTTWSEKLGLCNRVYRR